MTTEKTYNGWANYATWRVNLEILDGNDFGGIVFDNIVELAAYLKDMAFSAVFDESEDTDGLRLMRGYADAFMGEVDYYEIARFKADEHEGLVKASLV